MLAKALQGAALATQPAYIEDVFSTHLYAGNSAVQTINNGIALGSNYGGSIYFNGSTSAAGTPFNSALKLTSGDWTVEFWIKTGGSTANSGIWQQDFTNSYGGILITCTGLNIYFSSSTSGTSWNYLNQLIGTCVADTWNHVAITKSGDTVRGFLNGNLNLTINSFPSTIYSTAGGGRFGQYSTIYLIGQLSNFRIVKGTALYISAFTPPTSPLTAVANTSLLTFKSPSLTTDYSPNAFSITTANVIEQNGGGPFTDSTANKGGLVWTKSRSNALQHALIDTVRGLGRILSTNATTAQSAQTTDTLATITGFTSSGYTLGNDPGNWGTNFNAYTYASWTFRKQAKFFDVVTYTGNGVAGRTISHSLGSTPGCIIVKQTSASGQDWMVYHRSLATNGYLLLNSTGAASTYPYLYGPTSTTFTVDSSAPVNANGATYVAYLFAHDAGGFGASGTDNVISCGSFVGAGSTTPVTINLGWEPQWILAKQSSGAGGNWVIVDNMRGFTATTNGNVVLYPNATTADDPGNYVPGQPTSIGMNGLWSSGETYIYIAIRRGPMRTPTSGTSVFALNTIAPATSMNPGFPADMALAKRTGAIVAANVGSRLVGGSGYNQTPATAAELTSAGLWSWDLQNDFKHNYGTTPLVTYLARRAPNFFDVVCYKGTGANRTINHNLSVAPELMIIKDRTSAVAWAVYSSALANTEYLVLNTTAAKATGATYWNSTTPTSSVFSLGTANSVNAINDNFFAYLFASCPGVSKVGSYTGNGSSQTINCGFAAGARFVMIKRTDSTGDWYVWDTARGIVSGNDPHLSLNSTAADVTTDDSIDPDVSGFIVNQDAATNINVNSAAYIYLAIA